MNLDNKEIGLTYFKSLQSPHDIRMAITDLSRDFDGKVLVKLESQTNPDKVFYFNPHHMQLGFDNTYQKLQVMLGNYRLGITNVESVELKMVPKSPFMEVPLQASERILKKRGYQKDESEGIIGLFSKVKKTK